VGASGIANLEREAHLSGPIHSKGFLILSGFFAGRYGQDKPLALDARITFEQSYDEVEGDSASSTELYALMSALADLPLRQDVAVTGSVDQEGRIQPVGGVTQKVEGFFEACRQCGLTGRQGVVIPATNVRNLVLREEVAEAVRDGQFAIWAIDSVDQGIEILTGVPAGVRRADGGWEPGSVNDRVNHRLDDFASRLRAFGRGGEAGRETLVMPSPPVTPQTPRVDRPSRKVRRR
jgi:predicted ATP-dependent protease